MSSIKKIKNDSLSAYANLFAAIGGGMILGKGIGVIDLPYLQAGSVLAFFIGTLLGLGFLQLVPKNIASKVVRWFSLLSGLTSLTLLAMFRSWNINEKMLGLSGLVFFVLLSVRFAFWFYSRVLRAAAVAGQDQRLARVELGYYLGMIIGLVFWKILGFDWGLSFALTVDVILQLTASYIDFHARNFKTSSSEVQPTNPMPLTDSITASVFSKQWLWRLSGTVVFLTIGTQVTIFSLTHRLPEQDGSFLLAIFYLGVSLAAICCKVYKPFLTWKEASALPTVCYTRTQMEKSVSVLLLMIIATVSIFLMILNTFSAFSSLTYFFVLVSAFIYEILSLIFLDRLGLEESQLSQTGMIMRTYGLMGVGAAVFLWGLSLAPDSFSSLLWTLGVSMLGSVFLVVRRRQLDVFIERTGAA